MEPRKFSAPYLPWKTFWNLLDRMEEEGTPDRIDRSYLPTLSGNDQSYLMSALRTFGLTDADNSVQPAAEDLRNKETRPAAVRSLLETHYPEVLALPQNATQSQLDEVFRGYGLRSADATRKAQTFFLRAAAYAGITVSPLFKNPSAAPGEGGGRPRRLGTKRRTRRDSSDHPPTPPPASNPPPGTLNVPVHPMLSGSIIWLAENGASWTDEQATTWIDSFAANVRLVYPGQKGPQRTRREPRPHEPEAEPVEDEEAATGSEE